MDQELEENGKNILETLLKPFLQKILDLINQEQYTKIYFFCVIFIFVFIGLIWLFAFIRSQTKIKSELKKNNEERKAMQLSNLEKLSQLKDNYVNDISKLQMITIQLINAIKRNDVSDIKTKMMTLRRSLFNNTFNSFENFIESYSIVYESEYYRFRDLFNFQYKTFLKTLIKYMEIINKPEILTKIQLKKYKIDSSIFESKYSFMKHHLPRYYIISRIKNYYYFKKFSNLFI